MCFYCFRGLNRLNDFLHSIVDRHAFVGNSTMHNMLTVLLIKIKNKNVDCIVDYIT